MYPALISDFSISLIVAPVPSPSVRNNRLECLDYVIVHELAHLIEPNHSKNFWNIVSKYCSHYKELRKELR